MDCKVQPSSSPFGDWKPLPPHRLCSQPSPRESTFQVAVVQTLDSAIYRIKIYPMDSTIGFPNTYPLDTDLSGGYRCPTFEQQGPDRFWFFVTAIYKEFRHLFLPKLNPLYKGNISLVRDRQNRLFMDF